MAFLCCTIRANECGNGCLESKHSEYGQPRTFDYGGAPLASDIQSLANRLVQLDVSDSSWCWPSLVEQIWARQFQDESLVGLRDRVLQGVSGEATIDSDGVLKFDN